MNPANIDEHVWELAATGAYDDVAQLEEVLTGQFSWIEFRGFFRNEDNRTQVNDLCRKAKI